MPSARTPIQLLAALALVSGCSSLDLERGVYEGAQQYNRASQAPDGMPVREPAPDYRDYRGQRDQPQATQQSTTP